MNIKVKENELQLVQLDKNLEITNLKNNKVIIMFNTNLPQNEFDIETIIMFSSPILED